MAAPRKLVLSLLAVAALALLGWTLLGRKGTTGPAPVPATATAVQVARVEMRDVPVTVGALGQAQGWQAVLVRPQVSGRLLQVPVREGADVARGDLLAEIEPSPYRAALTQAQGALRRDQAQLELARLKLERFRQLAGSQGIAALDVDTQAALVRQFEGAVMIDEGLVDSAQVNLGHTQVFAPVAGRVGIRIVDPGNLVSNTDTTGIITINQISPIAVTFTLPQGEFGRLAQASDGFRKPLVTEAYGQESGELLDTGELVVVDNRVDSSTATVQLKARFPNERHGLWPGQLLNVKLTLQTLPGVLSLPSIAVNQGPQGPFAYVIEGDVAVMRPLAVALVQDETTVVKSGVSAGESVVIEGQGSLRPGARVAVRNP